MKYGRQIRVFLADGTPSGIKYAELVSWTGQAFYCPKTKLPELKDWPETKRPGVYILTGVDENGSVSAYIGESENVLQRLQAHLSKPPFEFTEIIIFTNKDDNITKGHITFLEEKLITRAKEANRFEIKSEREPNEKSLSKPERDTMLEFLENIFLVTATLGNPIFELSSVDLKPKKKDIFLFELGHQNLQAKGIPTDEGFLVLKESQVKLDTAESLQGGYLQLRQELLNRGILIQENNHFKFTQDYSFKSSTAAACIVSGNHRSGPQSWKTEDNLTLADYDVKKSETIKSE